MLNISFYTANNQPSHHVEIAENFLEWLARSNFSKIGEDKPTKIWIDGEKETLSLVKLGKVNRQSFSDFFTEAIVSETKVILEMLANSSVQEERIYRLKKLIELLDCMKDEKYQYLQRI